MKLQSKTMLLINNYYYTCPLELNFDSISFSQVVMPWNDHDRFVWIFIESSSHKFWVFLTWNLGQQLGYQIWMDSDYHVAMAYYRKFITSSMDVRRMCQKKKRYKAIGFGTDTKHIYYIYTVKTVDCSGYGMWFQW